MLVQPVYTDLPLRKLKITPALPGSLLLLALAAFPVQSAEPAPTSHQSDYRIRSQSLDKALVDFSLESGLQIIADGKLTAGVKSSGVSGRYSPEQALQKLLKGTGITVQTSRNGTVTLEKQAAVQPQSSTTILPADTVAGKPTESVVILKPMTVTAKDGYDAKDPYNQDYVLPNATSGTKTDTPIMETPLNVQVISKQVLKDQQVIKFDDALKNVSGVTIDPAFNGGLVGTGAIFLRGFQTNTTFRNGLRIDNTFGLATREIANVENIEVLKGPAAILYGRVEPGGLVNKVTKQPLATPYYALSQQFGSYDLYRTTIDATGPLTKDDTLLYRTNLSYQNNDSFRDGVSNENVFFAPVLKWNISPQTQATLELEYSHVTTNLDRQSRVLDINNQIINLPPSRNLGQSSPYQADTILVGLNWSHQFNDDWSIKHQVLYNSVDSNSTLQLPGDFNQDTNLLTRSAFQERAQNDTIATNIDLTGHFDTWGLKHTVLLGGDYYRFSYDPDYIRFSGDASAVNVFDPNSQVTSLDPTFVSDELNRRNTDNYGVYLQDQIKLPYNVQVLGGLRYQYVHSTSSVLDRLNNVLTTNTPQTDDAVTPRVGLLWQLQNWLSLYSNYVENFGANSGRFAFVEGSASGKPLSPETAQQWEVGAKTEFFDGRLRATLAYYDLTKQNVATTDTAHQFECGGACSIAVGEVRSRGPEVDIQGELLPGWNLIATYANQDVRVTKSNDTEGGAVVGNRLGYAPRNIGSFWSTYEVQQGTLDGVKFGGGVTLQDGVVSNDNTLKSPGYALVNLLAGYSFEVGKSKITAQLNVDNLLDKTYFTNATPSGINSIYGVFSTPRTFLGSIKVEY